MALEVDGEGHVKVHVFIVLTVWKKTGEIVEDDCPVVIQDSDYVSGLDKARRISDDIEENDPYHGTDDAITGWIVQDYFWRGVEI